MYPPECNTRECWEKDASADLQGRDDKVLLPSVTVFYL